MPDSFGCRRCYGEDPRAAWAYYEEGLAVERELVGDSHFLVQLRRCAELRAAVRLDLRRGGRLEGRRRRPAPGDRPGERHRSGGGRQAGLSLARSPWGRPALPRNGLGHRCGRPLGRVVDGRASVATKSASLGDPADVGLAPQQSPFALGSSSPRARGARWWVAGSRPESKSAGPVRSVYARRASAGVKPSRSRPPNPVPQRD